MPLFKSAKNLPPPEVLKGQNLAASTTDVAQPAETVEIKLKKQNEASSTIIFLCSVIIMLIVVIFFMGIKLTGMADATVQVPTIDYEDNSNSISPYKLK